MIASSRVSVGEDRLKEAPSEVQAELQEAFPELFYEWMPRAARWAVKRRVPWDQVDRLASEGKITEADVWSFVEARAMDGKEDEGTEMVVHAFTLPKGMEPGSSVVDLLNSRDIHNHPKGVRGVMKDNIERRKQQEAELEKMQSDAISDLVNERSGELEGRVSVALPENPIGKRSG